MNQQRHLTRGLLIGVLASVAFGTSGAFIKPLLEGGWSPGAAVTARVGVAGLILAPVAIIALRGRWAALWRARGRILAMALVGVAGTQLVYFAAIQRIPVSTAVLIEYLAPIILVAFAWARTRRVPPAVVLIGAVVAMGGLVLVVGPGSLVAADGLGLFFAALAAVGCAGYYLIAARPSDGLPPVAFAAAGLLLGALALILVGAVGIVPLSADFGTIPMFGTEVPWWVNLAIVAVLSTAIAYVTSIAASEMLGSRLMSFVGLLEVVFASLFAWVLIGEALTPVQLLGGALILAGIALVRAEQWSAPPGTAGVDGVSVRESAPESVVEFAEVRASRASETRAL